MVKEIVIYEKKIFIYMYRSSTITPKREWKTARQNCINGSILQVLLCYTLKVQNNIMEFFYVYDIMLYTSTRVEYTCSIDVKDIATLIMHIRKYNNVLFCSFTYLFSTLTFTQL